MSWQDISSISPMDAPTVIANDPEPNDVRGMVEIQWSINQARKERGQRPISPPKDFRLRYSKVRSMEFVRDHTIRGWTLAHNAKPKPVKRATKKAVRK